jgi:hypothetical protein
VSSSADDDVSPEEWAEYRRLLRRAEAMPDVAKIAAMRAAAMARPPAGVSDAEVYASEALILGHLAELRQLLGELEELFGEPAAPRPPLARLRRRSVSAGPGTGRRNARHRRTAP